MHTHPSRPPVRGRPAHITICGSTYYWLSSVNDFSDSWYPQAGLGSRHDGIRSSPRCKTFQGSKLILVEIATTRLIQRRVISYQLLQGSFFFPRRDENLICCLLPLFILYKYYIIFFYKSQKRFFNERGFFILGLPLYPSQPFNHFGFWSG